MKHLFLIIIQLLSAVILSAQYQVSGGNGTPLLAEHNQNNKLYVYLLDGLGGASVSYTSSEGTHQWYKYKESAVNAMPIDCIQTGNTSVISNLEDGCGYFVGSTSSTSTEYVWIMDYSQYLPAFFKLEYDEEEEDKCSMIKLLADVEAEELKYVTPSGYTQQLTRTYTIKYRTMAWNEENLTFDITDASFEQKNHVGEIVISPAPLMDTEFTLTGDAFAQHFGKEQTLTTPVYSAISVEAHATAESDKEFGENESSNEQSLSAPVSYTFTGYANEPVAARYTWKVYKRDDATMKYNTIINYTDKVLRYTFSEDAAYRVMLEVIDANAMCVDSIEVVSFIIGETQMILPNAFSPGSSVGVNDIYKVYYSSILSFKASIYNRWGNLLYQWTDPNAGWDGRVHGKYVPTGVYFIIVEYTDSSGKKKSASRDINIIRKKE